MHFVLFNRTFLNCTPIVLFSLNEQNELHTACRYLYFLTLFAVRINGDSVPDQNG
jgi:hypothetical protein